MSDPDLVIGHEIITSCLEPIANRCKDKGLDVGFMGKFPWIKNYYKEILLSPQTVQ